MSHLGQEVDTYQFETSSAYREALIQQRGQQIATKIHDEHLKRVNYNVRETVLASLALVTQSDERKFYKNFQNQKSGGNGQKRNLDESMIPKHADVGFNVPQVEACIKKLRSQKLKKFTEKIIFSQKTLDFYDLKNMIRVENVGDMQETFKARLNPQIFDQKIEELRKQNKIILDLSGTDHPRLSTNKKKTDNITPVKNPKSIFDGPQNLYEASKIEEEPEQDYYTASKFGLNRSRPEGNNNLNVEQELSQINNLQNLDTNTKSQFKDQLRGAVTDQGYNQPQHYDNQQYKGSVRETEVRGTERGQGLMVSDLEVDPSIAQSRLKIYDRAANWVPNFQVQQPPRKDLPAPNARVSQFPPMDQPGNRLFDQGIYGKARGNQKVLEDVGIQRQLIQQTLYVDNRFFDGQGYRCDKDNSILDKKIQDLMLGLAKKKMSLKMMLNDEFDYKYGY